MDSDTHQVTDAMITASNLEFERLFKLSPLGSMSNDGPMKLYAEYWFKRGSQYGAIQII